jgi:hypothetical protein
MHGIRSIAVRTGSIGGVAFLLNALIPYSASYAYIWPFVTGAATYWIATRAAAPRRILRGMSTVLLAGVIVGVIGFVGSTLVLLAPSSPVLRPVAESLGVAGRALVTTVALVALAAIAGVGVLATVIGGILMIPVRLVAMRTSGSSAVAP